MEQSQAVAFMVGTTAIVLGFSLVIRWRDWSEWMRINAGRGVQ